jgi:hypothetical protein
LQATKHHPASVDLELVKRLVTTTKASTLKAFLSKEFSNISKDYAGTPPPTSISWCSVVLGSYYDSVKFEPPDALLLLGSHPRNLPLNP